MSYLDFLFVCLRKNNHIWAISMGATYSFPIIIIAFDDIKFKPNPIPNNLNRVFFFFFSNLFDIELAMYSLTKRK